MCVIVREREEADLRKIKMKRFHINQTATTESF